LTQLSMQAFSYRKASFSASCHTTTKS